MCDDDRNPLEFSAFYTRRIRSSRRAGEITLLLARPLEEHYILLEEFVAELQVVAMPASQSTEHRTLLSMWILAYQRGGEAKERDCGLTHTFKLIPL